MSASDHSLSSAQFTLFESLDHTELYSKYRPTYPKELYTEGILSKLQTQNGVVCLDVACGSGQASFDLASCCKLVIGVDPSVNQIGQAQKRLEGGHVKNVVFEVGNAENLDVILQKHGILLNGKKSEVFDLITVAQGLHWFDFKVFFSQVERLLKKGGVFAAWCYNTNVFENEKAQQVLMELYDGEDLKDCWTPRRFIIDDKYRTIPHVPFSEHVEYSSNTKSTRKITLENYIGFINTWSAINTYGEKHGQEAKNKLMEKFKSKLMEALSLESDQDEFDFTVILNLLTTKKPLE